MKNLSPSIKRASKGSEIDPERGKKLIEVGLPIGKISSLAEKEANGRKTIYRIHKWWARRLGTVFRSLLIGAFMHSFTTPGQFIDTFNSERRIGEGKIVLDSFLGGGTTAVEALRLGSKVIGIDINPVSWFISKKEVEPIKLNLMKKEFEILKKTVGNEILELYSTKCTKGHEAKIVYALWNYKATCSSCKRESDLFRDHIVLEKRSSQGEVEFVLHCEYCGNIFSSHSRGIQKCPKCNMQINARLGNTRNGIFKCICGSERRIVDMVKENGGPLERAMFAIEYDCPKCGRGFKAPSRSDLEKFLGIKRRFEISKDSLLYPKEGVKTSESDKRPVNHGYKYFYQLFNERQLLSLSLLLNGIMQVRDLSTREFLLLAFSASLETNNLLCKYETKWDKISATFAIPAYHPTERIAENNVWGGRYGRGTFVKSYRKILLAKGVGLKGTMDEKVKYIPVNSPYRFTKLAHSYIKLKANDSDVLLKCADSEKMTFLPNESVDLVLTDPPYFDNFTYSRLSDFFYVWLKIPLSTVYPRFFGKPTSMRRQEIVLDRKTGKSLNNVVKSLSRVFSECNRVMRKDGLLVFTFHHNQLWAWEGLYDSVKTSGFTIVNTIYIRSESITGYRKAGKISYDACIVCKKGVQEPSRADLSAARRSSKLWVRKLVKAGNGLHDADVRSIVMGEIARFNPSLLSDKSKENKLNTLTNECIQLRDKLKSENTDKTEN